MLYRSLGLAAAALALSGCASLNNLSNDVSTYGPWPADRKPASFVFERLPSQQANPQHQQQLEDAARGAVEAAGFRASASEAQAEYMMQVGARVYTNDPWIYNEPLFWRGSWRYGYSPRRGRGPFYGMYGGWGYPYPSSQNFEREVVLLIRDHRNGQLLYEARASNVGLSASIDSLLPAMFEAAMKDFPGGGPNPRQVTTQISKQ